MSTKLLALLLWTALSILPAGGAFAAPPEDLDTAFEAFWKAKKPSEVRSAIAAVIAADPAFDEVYERLRIGRSYSSDVATGLLLRTRDRTFHYAVLVPEDYDPRRRYPVVFALHGGVSRRRPSPDGSWWGDYDSVRDPDRISVFPASWNEARWWDDSQVENLEAILAALKRDYNVDENRVSVGGISDGGTGAYYYAFRAPTPWASFMALIGHPGVLRNLQLYIPNLVNRPFFVVNAGKDQLYPSESVRPFIELMDRVGADVRFIDKPDSTHSMSWWPEEKARAEAFVKAHPRDPMPEKIVWETQSTDRHHRCDWLLITKLGKVAGESDLEDVNSFGGPSSRAIFPRIDRSGRVDLERRGNHVEARTRGVTRFRLLLSPDEFDFARPVTVAVNGREAFRGRVATDLGTLLRRAADDQDRTTLFAAEIEVEVPGP